jgi:hypothetical protein
MLPTRNHRLDLRVGTATSGCAAGPLRSSVAPRKSFPWATAGRRRRWRQAMMWIACATLVLGNLAPARAATAADTHVGAVSGSDEHWHRVELPPGPGQPGGISQITVAIETKGLHLAGRIRLPGGIASNFETANGKAVVDLLNVGSTQSGYAAVTAVEIQFDEAAADQPFTIMTIDYRAK